MRLVKVALLAALVAGTGLALRVDAAPRKADAPRVIRTQPLQMTGIRPRGRVVRTDKLRMTGIRPRTRVVTVPKLRMTGLDPER